MAEKEKQSKKKIEVEVPPGGEVHVTVKAPEDKKPQESTGRRRLLG